MAIFSSIGNVGLDVNIHHLVNATGGKSHNLTVQKIGRGLRRAADKDILHMHDFEMGFHPTLARHSKARIRTMKIEGHSLQFEKPILPFESA